MDRPKWMRGNGYGMALLVLLALSVLVQRVWIVQNQAPPMYFDDADHLYTSLTLYRTWAAHGIVQFKKQFFRSVSHHFHPPLIPALATPFYATLGQTVAAALWVNTLFLLLFYMYLFKLVRYLADERSALLTVTITALLPMTYGLARIFLLEFGLAAIVVMWLYYFYRSDGLTKIRYLPGLALLFGCGMLTKATFPIYIVGPVAWEIFQRFQLDPRATLQTLIARLTIMGGIGGGMALPWYRKHLSGTWRAVEMVSGDVNRWDGLKTALAWPMLKVYAVKVIREGLSIYFVVLGLALIALLLLRREKISARPLGVLLAWLIPPILIFSATTMKIDRYLFPAFPAVAALLSLALIPILPAAHVRRALVLGALLLIPLGNFFQLSFFDVWSRLPKSVLAREPLGLLEKTRSYEFSQRPRRAPWPLEAMLRTMQTHSTRSLSQEIRGGVCCSRFELVPSNLMFAGAVQHIPATFRFVYSAQAPPAPYLKTQMDLEYFVIERAFPPCAPMAQALDTGRLPYRALQTVSLPAESHPQVVIYQRLDPAAQETQ